MNFTNGNLFDNPLMVLTIAMDRIVSSLIKVNYPTKLVFCCILICSHITTTTIAVARIIVFGYGYDNFPCNEVNDK